MIDEGQIIEINGQKYLVVSVEYSGYYGSSWVRSLELRGIRGD